MRWQTRFAGPLVLLGSFALAAPGGAATRPFARVPAPAPSATVLHNFTGNDGLGPWEGVVADASGALYGTTGLGGATSPSCSLGCGAVYKVAPTSSGGYTESVLYSFQGGADGFIPKSNLVFDRSGALYGTTEYGGIASSPNAFGTVFKLTPTGSGGYTESILYAFQGGTDGANPQAGLVIDKKGVLYGTTTSGGGATGCVGSHMGCGTVFSLTPHRKNGIVTYSETILHSFQGGIDGGQPAAPLLLTKGGTLLGTAENFGADGWGTAFALTRGASGYTFNVIYAFTGGSNAAFPMSPFIEDRNGALYGTTIYGGYKDCAGGTQSCGTVYKLTPTGSGTYTETLLWGFHQSDGANPYSGLVAGKQGVLYGTTAEGGTGCPSDQYGCGTIFELMPQGSGYVERVLLSFNESNGRSPYGTMIGRKGKLYGTTVGGGTGCSGGCGTVFEMTQR